MATSITMQLLDYTLDEDFRKAKVLCDEATVEINTQNAVNNLQTTRNKLSRQLEK
jgi:hypothetical protein